MLNIAICDDEKYICDFLKKSVTDCLAKADIEGSISVFDDGQPLCDLYREGRASFDLILLDITMKMTQHFVISFVCHNGSICGSILFTLFFCFFLIFNSKDMT